MSQYKPHQPGEAPPKPERDGNGVHVHQQFTAKKPAPDTCPPGMVRDAAGQCVTPTEEG